jgi:cytochrome c peroxidase
MYVGGQFWDGRASRLADQAKGPFLNPVEMAMPSKAAVLARIADEDNPNNDRYRKLFNKVYKVDIEKYKASKKNPPPADPVYDLVADAIAAFEKTRLFTAFSSKYDYFLVGKAPLTAAEQNGLALFNGKGGCAACHTSSPTTALDGKLVPPLFTDHTYDNIGIPKSRHPLLASNSVDTGLGGRADVAANDPAGNELGKFKVMTLRNIAITAPYGHNGFFASLEDIVRFYNTRDVPAANWPPAEVVQNMNSRELGNLGLTAQEEAELVAFLKTLTDGYGEPLTEIALPPMP